MPTIRVAGWLGRVGAIVALALFAATIVLARQWLEPPGVPEPPPLRLEPPRPYVPAPPLPEEPQVRPPAAESRRPASLDPWAADRAIAVGYLLDVPRSRAVIDRSLEIAEKLRQRYGIDTGDPVADRERAARRAQEEIVDRLEVSERQLALAAAELGFSLDTRICGDTCDNVRRLALLELQRRALADFVSERVSSRAH